MKSYSAIREHTTTYLRLITTELSVAVRKSFQTNGELDVTTAHNILNLEFRELGIEPELLHYTCVLARCQSRIIFGLGTSDDHLARCEDQRGRLGFTYTHDDGRKTLQRGAMTREALDIHTRSEKNRITNLGVILRISRMQRDRLEVKPAIQVDRRDNVLKRRDNAFYCCNVLLFKRERCWR